MPLIALVEVEQRRRQARRSRPPTTRREANAMSRHHARAGDQHGDGRDQGLREEARRWSASATAPQAQGDKLNLTLGFSHPVVHQMPEGIKVETPTQTEIVIKGIDKPARRPGRRRDPRATARPSPTRARACATRTRDRAQRNQEEVRGCTMIDQERSRVCAARARPASRSRAAGVARLTVHRTNQHIYAQVIDADGAKVLATASTVQKRSAQGRLQERRQRKAAAAGRQAHRREGEGSRRREGRVRPRRFPYHGRVKALADAAREAGLKF